jgi:arginine decarboxylase
VTAGEKGYRIKFLVEGDTVRDVLGYVQYGKGELIRYLRESIEEAYEERELDIADGKRLIEAYERAMEGYTYLGS